MSKIFIEHSFKEKKPEKSGYYNTWDGRLWYSISDGWFKSHTSKVRCNPLVWLEDKEASFYTSDEQLEYDRWIISFALGAATNGGINVTHVAKLARQSYIKKQRELKIKDL